MSILDETVNEIPKETDEDKKYHLIWVNGPAPKIGEIRTAVCGKKILVKDPKADPPNKCPICVDIDNRLAQKESN